MCCFSTKHAPLRRKIKDWLARNQNNVSEWSDMSTRGLLFQWAKSVGLEQSGHHYHLIERNLFSPWHSWKSNHSITRLFVFIYSSNKVAVNFLLNCFQNDKFQWEVKYDIELSTCEEVSKSYSVWTKHTYFF